MADLVGVKTLSEWTPKLWAEASDDAPHLLGATRQPSAGSQACPRPRGGNPRSVHYSTPATCRITRPGRTSRRPSSRTGRETPSEGVADDAREDAAPSRRAGRKRVEVAQDAPEGRRRPPIARRERSLSPCLRPACSPLPLARSAGSRLRGPALPSPETGW